MGLQDKVVVITNAASAQGRAQAIRFAADGAAVALLDPHDADRDGVAGELVASAGALSLHVDATDETDWANAIDSIVEHHGRIDVLVHNAHAEARETVPRQTITEWDQAFESAATGGFLGVRSVLPAMLGQSYGSIVLVTSVAAMAPPRGLSEAHSATAGALRQLAKDVSADYAADGIRCNALFAGLVDGGLLGADPSLTFAAAEEMRLVTPMRRSGRHDEIAAAVRFLASDEASFVTGAELVVDGGYVGF